MIVDIATGSCVQLRLDAALYPEVVVFKCFYWYGGLFDVEIERGSLNQFVVTLQPRAGLLTEKEIGELQSRVKRDLIDFKTRHFVANETRTIRELLVAKAFASADDVDVG